MADAKRKPTPAQRRRLEQISRGEITRRGSSWALGFYHSTGCATGGITYTMMCGLHEAGWITADATEREHECVLKLTEAGRAALGVMACGEAQPVELPDDGELEAWRSAADALLSHKPPTQYELRRAAMLLQNAYMFARKLRSASGVAPSCHQTPCTEPRRARRDQHVDADPRIGPVRARP